MEQGAPAVPVSGGQPSSCSPHPASLSPSRLEEALHRHPNEDHHAQVSTGRLHLGLCPRGLFLTLPAGPDLCSDAWAALPSGSVLLLQGPLRPTSWGPPPSSPLCFSSNPSLHPPTHPLIVYLLFPPICPSTPLQLSPPMAPRSLLRHPCVPGGDRALAVGRTMWVPGEAAPLAWAVVGSEQLHARSWRRGPEEATGLASFSAWWRS